MKLFATTEHYYPTIMVSYIENNPTNKVFVAMIFMEQHTCATVFVASSTQEEAEKALLKMHGVTGIEKIQPLSQALEILEQAAFEEETIM